MSGDNINPPPAPADVVQGCPHLGQGERMPRPIKNMNRGDEDYARGERRQRAGRDEWIKSDRVKTALSTEASLAKPFTGSKRQIEAQALRATE